ncbi:growth arrest and DNA damage-inducible proteins-interacting protein 1 [Ornithorhynchus anatinus]|uniref:Large ribosomal subunit protein mL64 n=1 Tax=Ornithorhynchus anatinus TaxID=9258 RepID=A0A6I8PHK6_ORNAN|nr:growth arrest and DNA damage-inducible proteins-interacting protein 1 [Ornithorhynchus anatinus]
MAAPTRQACGGGGGRLFLFILRRLPAPPSPASRSYKVRPVPNWPRRPRFPDPEDPLTPTWQLTPQYAAKQYGRFGAASGLDPARLWPGPERLRELEAEEREWYPSLRDMQEALREKERLREEKRLARENLIKANMAKMPQMIADWRREKKERWEKAQADKLRRGRLLAEAREQLGYNVDPRSTKFQELVRDLEKKQRKQLKEQKQQQKLEARAAALQAAAAASPE